MPCFNIPLLPLQVAWSNHDGTSKFGVHLVTNRDKALAERRTSLSGEFYSDHLTQAVGSDDASTAQIIDGKVYHDRVFRYRGKVVHRVTAAQRHAADQVELERIEARRAELATPIEQAS